MSDNVTITWILRVVGLVVLFIAFAMIMAPVGIVADVIPLLGSIVRMGTGLVAFLLAVLVGGVTIAVAWFYYRPLLSVAIIAGTLVVAAAITYLARSRKSLAAAPAPVPEQAAPRPIPPVAAEPAPSVTPTAPGTHSTIKW